MAALTGMTGALAPFSFLVFLYVTCKCVQYVRVSVSAKPFHSSVMHTLAYLANCYVTRKTNFSG
jgi:hypothetical protein